MSGSYNPLADKSIHDTQDTWVCTAAGRVFLFVSDSFDSQPEKEIKPGAQISATKEGNWLREKDTGLYAPCLDKSGNRNFKNTRLMLMEQVSRQQPDGDCFQRQTSKGSHCSTASSTHSCESVASSKLSRRQSFRWVDSEGEAHRLEGSSEALKDMTEACPEVWICVAGGGVPYRSAPRFDCGVSSVECPVGSKVNAVKEGEWLRVLSVKQTWDAASIGRRSLKAATRITVEETGLYLPMVEGGQKLFKNQKLARFQEASQAQDECGAKKEDGACTVM